MIRPSKKELTTVIGNIERERPEPYPVWKDAEHVLLAEVTALNASIIAANERWFASNRCITNLEDIIEQAQELVRKWNAMAVNTHGSSFAAGSKFALQACAEELEKMLRGGK